MIYVAVVVYSGSSRVWSLGHDALSSLMMLFSLDLSLGHNLYVPLAHTSVLKACFFCLVYLTIRLLLCKKNKIK